MKPSRAGNTYSMFNVNLIFQNIEAQFPLITAKKMNWKGIVAEFLWILSGESNITELKKTTKIWDKFSDKNDEVNSAYGHIIRNFSTWPLGLVVDQLEYVINLLKKDPFSRRAVMTSWDPRNAHNSNLPPCHFAYVFNVHPPRKPDNRMIVNLNVTQRSGDLALGVPWDIAIWSLMLLYIANILGMKAGSVSFNIVDAHIYSNHVNGVLEWLRREPRALPRVTIIAKQELSRKVSPNIFLLENYDPHGSVSFQLNKGEL